MSLVGPTSELERRLGPTPRDVGALREGVGPYPAFVVPPRPEEVGAGHALAPCWTYPDDPLERGDLAVAVPILASNQLWQPGEGDGNATVLYTFDLNVWHRPERLQGWARHVEGWFRHHEGERPPVPRSPWHRLIRDMIHLGGPVRGHHRLPPELTEGRVVYLGSLPVRRDDLPDGHLSTPFLPILVARHTLEPAATLVPSGWWPARWFAMD